jgi:transglutaminase-like putative cysteine protease
VESREWSQQILQQRAVEDAKSTSIRYSTSIQKAEVLAAFTQKADGRRIDAPKSNYQVEVNSGQDRDAPVFSDITTLTVVFPEVAVGDTLHFSYRVTQTEPMFPGQFSDMDVFGHTTAYDAVRVRLDAPAALWLQYQANQMRQTQDRTDAGRRVLEWTYSNPAPARDKRRDFSVFDVESEPGVSYSTFRTYAEIAEAYGARARAKARPDERVRKLAAEIVGKRAAAREQAQALYEWVATNITYGGNCIGIGAVVPHDLSFVLDNKMGDCKDHATLLQALLAARGIDSTQALVNAGNGYRLPKIPVVSYVNHVINYIPSLSLYADSTSDTMPFGMLPFADADKPVLHVDGYRDGTRTPPPSAAANRQQMKSDLTIHEDGAISGTIEVTLDGLYAVYARSGMRQLAPDDEADLLENAFKRGGHMGKGTLDKDDPTALSDHYRYRATFEMQGFTALPGPAAFTVFPLLFSQAPIARYAGSATAPDQSFDYACTGGSSREDYLFHLPPNMKILAVPDDVEVTIGAHTYAARYKLDGATLAVTRSVDDRTAGSVCAAAKFADEKAFSARVLQDIKAQVVYK